MKDKKYVAWMVLSITGFALFALIIGSMAMDFYSISSHLNMHYTQTTFFSFFSLASVNHILGDTFILTLVMICLFLAWSIISFILQLVGQKKGKQYINPLVARTITIMSAFFLFALSLTIAIRMPIYVNSLPSGWLWSNSLNSGYYAFIIGAMVLSAVQIAGAFLNKRRQA